jgi:hypothetical protein
MNNKEIQEIIEKLLRKIENLKTVNTNVKILKGLCDITCMIIHKELQLNFLELMYYEYYRQTGKSKQINCYWWFDSFDLETWYSPRINFLNEWLKYLKTIENE